MLVVFHLAAKLKSPSLLRKERQSVSILLPQMWEEDCGKGHLRLSQAMMSRDASRIHANWDNACLPVSMNAAAAPTYSST